MPTACVTLKLSKFPYKNPSHTVEMPTTPTTGGGLSIDTALASFELPASPARSPVGGAETAVAVWLEATPDGEQRVHMALADASVPPALEPPTSRVPPLSDDAFAFPLAPAAPASSALVPFQKLQLDTNLNRTLLPYKQQPLAATANSSSSSPHSATGDSAGKKPPSAFAWGDAAETTSARMNSEFMHALRLGPDQRGRQRLPVAHEPELAVRLRGSRVELASPASEDDDVDFLGPAENIKKLFKLPYSHARVSLAVHRVGSTLVVDGELPDADLPAGFEGLLPMHETRTLEAQAAERQQQSLLYEKFLYESAVQGRLPTADETTETTHQPLLAADRHAPTPSTRATGGKKRHKKAKKRTTRSPLLADASWLEAEKASSANDRDARTSSNRSPSDQQPGPHQPPFSQAFERVLKWKFRDLKMVSLASATGRPVNVNLTLLCVYGQILGSQVLLFSNKEHPAVSLKLHDMDTDLSLITVLDYYLDNVIANIPELAICMHSNGLVRGYKLVETREIPYLSGATRPLFDIHDVSMNASMLLKFLQENCSRPNGTYWLHRKEGENALRLYDVNVLSEGKQLKWKYMMAMLCYRFASRAARLVDSLARDTPRLQRQLQQRQRELLSTCRTLLQEIADGGGATHSAICASVSEQLADTYLRELPSGTESTTREAENDSDSDDRVALIEALHKAKEHLLESIRSFEECMVPEHAVSASTSSLPNDNNDKDDQDGIQETFESPGRREEEAGDDINDDDDDDDEMNSFMDDERMRLELKCASVCLRLSQVHAKHREWADAVASIVGSCAFLPLSAVPASIAPLAATLSVRNHQIDDLLARLDFDGVGGARLDATSAFICAKGSELRCRVLELVGDIAAQLPTHQTEVLLGLYRVVGGEESALLATVTHPTRGRQWMDACERAERSREDEAAASGRCEELLSLSFYAYLRALAPSVDSELYLYVGTVCVKCLAVR